MPLTKPADPATAQGEQRTDRTAGPPGGHRAPPFGERSLWLLALLGAFGVLLLAFSFATVHRRSAAELDADPMTQRARYELAHWLEHGYLDSVGVLVRPDADGAPALYRSSTGAVQVPAFVAQKVHYALAGRASWPLLVLSNQVLSLFASMLVALLGYRLARRFQVTPLHALALACGVLAAHFTFPDNLMTFWEMSGRVPFLLAACVFLLLEERRSRHDGRRLALLQAGVALLVVLAEVITGAMFLLSYGIVSLLLGRSAPSIRRLLLVALLPLLLAVGAHRLQLAWATERHPDLVTMGSEFNFRTGFDGSLVYYDDHLDIAYGRDTARANFDPEVREGLFDWRGMFLAGCAALLLLLVAALRGRVPSIVTLSLFCLLGTYVLHAALFSQAVVIHPYLYDVLLFTPLVLALLVLLPALLHAVAREGGVVIVVAVFLAICVSMIQLRKYAIMYPQPTAAQASLGQHRTGPVPPVDQGCVPERIVERRRCRLGRGGA